MLKGADFLNIMDSLCASFTIDIDGMMEQLDFNERLDRECDRLRDEAFSNLLKGLDACRNNQRKDANRYLHIVVQKLHQQELINDDDDARRNKIRTMLTLLRQKTIRVAEEASKDRKKLKKK